MLFRSRWSMMVIRTVVVSVQLGCDRALVVVQLGRDRAFVVSVQLGRRNRAFVVPEQQKVIHCVMGKEESEMNMCL